MIKRNSNPLSALRLVALFATAILFIPGCGKKAEPETREVVRPVKMMTLSNGGLQREVSLPGQISPARQANMAFEIPGQMTDIYVTEGQEVTAGQLLAKLDPRDYQAALDAARAQLEIAQIEEKRARALFQSEAASKQTLDAAVSNLKVAQATFDKAEKAFNDTSLIAPIDGVVARILVEDIVAVAPKQDILILQDNSSLKVTVDIPETLSILADPNMTYEERTERTKVRVSLTALPDRSFPARMTEVSMTADPVTRTYKGTVIMDRPEDLNILPGMTAKVTASMPSRHTASAGSFSVPLQAVGATEEGKSFVWRVAPGDMAVSRVTVDTGAIVGENIEIASEGLSEGDRIVTSGVSQLVAGQKVREFNQ